MSILFEGDLFADYHQLVVEDVANADGSPDDFSEAAMQRRVTSSPHALVVFTARNMTVHLWAQPAAEARVLKQWTEGD